MADERLMDFPAKTTPVGDDIIYVGDSADAFNEVKSTISEIFAGYSGILASIAALSPLVADRMFYTSSTDTVAAATLTAFGRSLMDDSNAAGGRSTLGLGDASTRTATNAAKTYLASVDTAVIVGNVPVFTDVNGTIGDSGLTPSGLNIVAAARGATTANLAGYTYANGTSGVGATLTAGANGAFTSDGITWALNDLVLVKDQSTTFQNGLYKITTLGDGGTPAVLTRSVDYDQASQINLGDIIIVAEGTVNAQTSWMETATITTIGTDPITFVQFTANPATFLKVASNLSDLASVSTARTNLGLAGSFTGIAIQTFTATGAYTYTPNANMAYVLLMLQAGGGGSGGTTGAGGQSAAAGAGGGGGFFFLMATAAQIGASASGSVGAAGTAGASGNNPGGAGGNTTITIGGGTTWTAAGGGAGGGQASSATSQLGGAAGTGGTNTTGTNATLLLNLPGQNGGTGFSNGAVVTLYMEAGGGDSFLGKGGMPSHSSGANTGKNYGGGAGGFLNASGANAAGLAGAQGIVVAIEFLKP